MKRLQIMIDEDVDAELERRARREGVSKAALIRRFVGKEIRPRPQIQDDPIWGLIGAFPDAEPVRPGEIDDVVYGTGDPD